MSNYYQQIRLSIPDQAMREIMVALLADAGYEGFVEEPGTLLAYIPEEAFSQERLNEILEPFSYTYETERIAQRNWNAEWEAGFQPVRVGDFCMIRADFHPAVEGMQYDLVITPKMSFGTGHHATTYQMVESMKGMNFDGKTVLDFGTGTGILAILAKRMGAERVLAIDNDSWSIEKSQENLDRNGVDEIEIRLCDSLEGLGKFDIILANINKNVILREMEAMIEHCNPGGAILISGLLESDSTDLTAAIAGLPLTLKQKSNKDSWLCWQLQRI
jgi:ribosomal protein L11 methyltransferase